MSTEYNINGALKKCLKFLKSGLEDPIYEGLVSIFQDARENEEQKDIVRGFQQRLKRIKEWSQNIVDEEHDRISILAGGSDWIENLITAIFIANAKILSSTTKGRGDVNVPNTKKFIHKAYIESARRVYEDPLVMYEIFYPDRKLDRKSRDRSKRENIRQIKKMIGEGLEATVDSLMDARQILKFVTEAYEEPSQSKVAQTAGGQTDDEEEEEEYYSEDAESENEGIDESEALGEGPVDDSEAKNNLGDDVPEDIRRGMMEEAFDNGGEGTEPADNEDPTTTPVAFDKPIKSVPVNDPNGHLKGDSTNFFDDAGSDSD